MSSKERKWKDFLSSIKTFKCLSKNNLTITTESEISCLAKEFANNLLQKKGDTVVVQGNQDVSKNQTETPTTKRNIPLVNAETSVQNTDVFIPEVPQTDTNEHVKETSAQSVDAIFPEVPQTDTNEHVKETSTQNADAIIPAVRLNSFIRLM